MNGGLCWSRVLQAHDQGGYLCRSDRGFLGSILHCLVSNNAKSTRARTGSVCSDRSCRQSRSFAVHDQSIVACLVQQRDFYFLGQETLLSHWQLQVRIYATPTNVTAHSTKQHQSLEWSVRGHSDICISSPTCCRRKCLSSRFVVTG